MASPVQYPAPIETVRPPVVVIGGDTTAVTTTRLRTLVAAGSAVYSFTAAFVFMRAGQLLHFKSGASCVLDAALITALQAVSAPMVAA